MTYQRAGRRECFTAEQANAMLPLLRAIVSDLADVSRQVIERRRRLSFFLSGRDLNRREPCRQELAQLEESLENDVRRLREYVEELRALGVEPTNGPEGIVTFPSALDGRRVCLSWKLGEPEVACWHETDAGYRQRRPLLADGVAAP